jgi:hypothetical protein
VCIITPRAPRPDRCWSASDSPGTLIRSKQGRHRSEDRLSTRAFRQTLHKTAWGMHGRGTEEQGSSNAPPGSFAPLPMNACTHTNARQCGVGQAPARGCQGESLPRKVAGVSVQYTHACISARHGAGSGGCPRICVQLLRGDTCTGPSAATAAKHKTQTRIVDPWPRSQKGMIFLEGGKRTLNVSTSAHTENNCTDQWFLIIICT